MRQILQSLKSGLTSVVDVPTPNVDRGQILIASSLSLISSGTERMLVDFGKAGWFNKARQQPEKVEAVINKIKTDGLFPTLEAVLNKLDQPIALGYCNVGKIIAVGTGVIGYKIGDRVISNGKHAEVVSVPTNLCAKVPESVPDEEAVFTVLGAIALQGIRLAQPTLGETIVVTGLGLIGLLTVQLLRAQGCRVLAIDYDKTRLEMARQFGAQVVDLSSGEDPVRAAEIYSRSRGVDAVIVTASTKSSEPIHQAATMCRKRGRVVLVGVTGLELSRDDFYNKELTLQVSSSYGPGRYDPKYEEKGLDYPVGFVRWTEQRNFEAVLDMIELGNLNVKPLISHQFDIDHAEHAYELVSGAGPSLGILLTYPGLEITSATKTLQLRMPSSTEACRLKGKATIGLIGSGSYATSVLIPAFKMSGAYLKSVASKSGVSGIYAGNKFGFECTTTETEHIFLDKDINAVVVSTRHESHSNLVCRALNAGKSIFVEKPLCLNLVELAEIQQIYDRVVNKGVMPQILMVGFNRRFAPQVQKIYQLLQAVKEPKAFVMTVNAGAIPVDHWAQDFESGGGRIIGEACHFIDLLRFLANSPLVKWDLIDLNTATRDTVSIQLSFLDGSIGTIHYFANGSRQFPKERLEIFAAGGILCLDNYRRLKGFGWPGFSKMNLWRQDKGQRACARAFVEAVEQGCESPIPLEELLEVAKISIELSFHN
jgi:predicted dehydrogenase/threonine dehydrogenase-like Zn-dependent dehydrogenase